MTQLNRFRRFASSLLIGGLLSLTLVTSAFAANLLGEGIGGTDLVTPEQCAQLDNSLGGALGCDGSDRIVDFTQYQGGLEPVDGSGLDPDLTRTSSVREFVTQIVNFAMGFLGLVAVAIVIYGGAMYLLSRGDEEMASKGKKTIGYAAIGIVIIAGSFAFVNTLLTATGGGVNRNQGGTVAGGAVIDSGESFDVESVLAELEDVTLTYLDAFQTQAYVRQEVDYMMNLEMPLVFNVNTTDATLSGAFEAFSELVSGQDRTYSDPSQLIDKLGVTRYLNELRTSIQRIQGKVDSLSDTYEATQVLYNYLRSDAGNNSFSSLAPRVHASDSGLDADASIELSALSDLTYEELFQQLQEDNATGPGCALLGGEDGYNTEQRSAGPLGATVFQTNVQRIDDEICPKLDLIRLAAIGDYTESIADLLARLQTLKALFDTSSAATAGGGSNLVVINEAFVNLIQRLTANDFSSKDNPPSAARTREIISGVDEIFDLIENLDFVSVQMTASAVQGNAPLIVRFDLLGTEDPSGRTVREEQISWDLNGDGVFGDAAGQPNKNAVSWQYDKPGTYRARVRVLSDSPNVAAGVASIPIRVGVRKSQIQLDAVTSGQRVTVADYSVFPVIDQSAFKVTEAEATEGILFDATATADGNGNQDGITFASWDFGDGEVLSGAWSQQEIQSPTHLYGEPGSYTVVFEVTDTSGNLDRKIFTLFVGSPAARMSVSPQSGIVGTQFRFDGRASSTDIGTIVSYRWSATKNGEAIPLNVTTGNTLTTSFDSPGVYNVTLTVVDSAGTEDEASRDILVESREPVAVYSHKVPESNKPAVYEFDATDSYDPDENDVLTYEWDIAGGDFQILEQSASRDVILVEFQEIEEYDVTLTVRDQHPEDLQKSDTAEKTILVDNILDVELTLSSTGGYFLDDEGVAEVELVGVSQNATAFEIDYGDGEVDFVEPITNQRTIFTHEYERAGVFYATLTAFDDDNKQNSTTRRVYVSTGDSPIAVLDVAAEEDIGTGELLRGSVNTRFTFDASNSVNIDGTNRNLRYSWNFGDGTVSTQRQVTYSFDERAEYTVSLTVKDSSDATLTSTSTVQINIEGIQPEIRRINVIPQSTELVTPLKVNVEVDVEDEDGQITFIRAWYFDLEETAEELGTVIAQSDAFTMTINTNGTEGQEKEYGFAIEVTDNDNQTVSSYDVLDEDQVPTLTVTNGPNDTPEASFAVDRTSIVVGESVTFSSTAFDPDGEIISYIWDVEGDGFFNNKSQTSPTFTHQFNQVYLEGVDVQLKVEDDAGATAVSEPLTIFVDSLAEAPQADFLAEVDSTVVSFTDTSTYDAENGSEADEVYWDFDGNGSIDDEGRSVTHDYEEMGTYTVTMNVVDSLGQIDEVTREVLVVDADPPSASFTYSADNYTVDFEDTSDTDRVAGVGVQRYEWDFDDDGKTDSLESDPSHVFEAYGEYPVTLTIIDDLGEVSSRTETVYVLDPLSGLKAILTSIPEPNRQKQVVVSGQSAEVSLFYSSKGQSTGQLRYEIDKNIFFDSDGDGIRDNDVDFSDQSAGSLKTTYFKTEGQTVTKLTVIDTQSGERNVATLQVVFEGFLGSANLFNATPRELLFVILTTLLAVSAGLGLTYYVNPKRV